MISYACLYVLELEQFDEIDADALDVLVFRFVLCVCVLCLQISMLCAARSLSDDAFIGLVFSAL